jgi:predicted  nucleic acid-binding Zn-ribbon protein
MSQKSEILEHLLIKLEEMEVEIKKHHHYVSYGKYDNKILDLDFLKDSAGRFYDEIEELEKAVEYEMPEEQKRIRSLENHNAALKDNIDSLNRKLSSCEKKLSFALTLDNKTEEIDSDKEMNADV